VDLFEPADQIINKDPSAPKILKLLSQDASSVARPVSVEKKATPNAPLIAPRAPTPSKPLVASGKRKAGDQLAGASGSSKRAKK